MYIYMIYMYIYIYNMPFSQVMICTHRSPTTVLRAPSDVELAFYNSPRLGPYSTNTAALYYTCTAPYMTHVKSYICHT